jgi:hypothetical protein
MKHIITINKFNSNIFKFNLKNYKYFSTKTPLIYINKFNIIKSEDKQNLFQLYYDNNLIFTYRIIIIKPGIFEIPFILTNNTVNDLHFAGIYYTIVNSNEFLILGNVSICILMGGSDNN